MRRTTTLNPEPVNLDPYHQNHFYTQTTNNQQQL